MTYLFLHPGHCTSTTPFWYARFVNWWVERSPQSETVQVNVRDNFGSICSRRGVEDVFVDNDNSFLDEGVVYSLVDKDFLVCKERLKRGKSGGVIRNRRKRPFVKRVMVTVNQVGAFTRISHTLMTPLTKFWPNLIDCVPNPSNFISRLCCHPQRWLRRTHQIQYATIEGY